MPYYNRRSYRKRNYRKRYTRRRKTGYGRIIKTINNVIDKRAEWKSCQAQSTAWTAYAVGTPVFELCNGIATGDSDETRSGNRVTLKSFTCTMGLRFDAALADDVFYKIILVLDTQPNGAQFSLTDLYDSSAMWPPSLRNPDGMKRFWIVAQRQGIINTDVASANALKNVRIYKKFNVKTRYGSTGATISDINTNALWLVHYVTTASTDTAYYYRAWRTRFTDI